MKKLTSYLLFILSILFFIGCNNKANFIINYNQEISFDNSFIFINGVDKIDSSKGLMINAVNDDPYIIFKHIELPKKIKSYKVNINLDVPFDTETKIYYTTYNSDYNEINSISNKVISGNNNISFIIKNKDFNGGLRLDPGTIKGNYTINDFIIYGYRGYLLDLFYFCIGITIFFFFTVYLIDIYKKRKKINIIVLSNKLLKLYQILIAGIFILMITLPLFQMKFKIFKDFNNYDNRKLSEKPKLPTKNNLDTLFLYKQDFEKYFNDNFGFRNIMIRLNNFIDVKVLKSVTNEKVLLGKKGWLFYNSPEDGVNFDDFIGNSNFTQNEIDKIVEKLKYFDEYTKEKNIYLLFVIAPNKQTIYSEYVPNYYLNKKSSYTRIDQIVHIFDSLNINYIDLRQKLIKNKNRYNIPLYYKTDTHWNQLGAFIGYEEIIQRIKSNFNLLPIIKIEDFSIKTINNNGNGDLAGFLNLPNFFSDSEVILNYKGNFKSYSTPPIYNLNSDSKLQKIDNSSLPKLLVYHDSFLEYLIPYLSESFSESAYQKYWNFNYQNIETVKPDIVMVELVERYITKILDGDINF